MSRKKKNDFDDEIEYEEVEYDDSANTELEDEDGEKKPHKFSKKVRIILIADIVLIVVWVIILAVIFGGKGIINCRYLSKINTEKEANVIKSTNEVEIETDENVVEEDNIDDALKNLIDGDAKSFFESGEPASASYVTNILLIGTDVRANHEEYGNSDSMVLVSINKKTKKIFLTSIMRDLYVYIPQVDINSRLNYAHEFGGSSFLCDTITGNFKVKVDKYVRVDFYSLMNIIDAAGGIDMELSDDEVAVANKEYVYYMCRDMGWDPTPYYIPASGNIHLNGMQAVAFARIRYVGNADYERTERQRRVLTTIFDKCKNMSISELDKFAQTSLENIFTNMENDDIWDIIDDAASYFGYEIVSQRVPFDDTSTGQYIDYQAVIVPDLKTNAEMLINSIYGE